jgi:ribose 5-phosphate isomerase B
MTRQHNDANILCMGARVIDYAKAEKLADLFLNTEFMGDKHAIRVGMISDIESGSFNG